jgi:hypothetical protein
MSRQALGAHSAPYPVQTGGCFHGYVKLTQLVPRLRMVELYLHSPITLRDVVLNEARVQLCLYVINVFFDLIFL